MHIGYVLKNVKRNWLSKNLENDNTCNIKIIEYSMCINYWIRLLSWDRQWLATLEAIK